MLYWFFVELQNVPNNCVSNSITEGMYVIMGTRIDIGWIQKNSFKATTYGKVNI
jgi:hypothetical protein